MEQTTQQISKKPALPRKTKIVAAIAIFFGVMSTIFTPILTLVSAMTPPHEISIFSFVNFLFGPLFFVSGIFLLLRKRGAWRFLKIIFTVWLILFIASIFNLGNLFIF